MSKQRFITVTILLSMAASLQAGTATIAIDTTQKGPAINPRMYGIFLEEINHGVDGGLYAELIRNRGFEDSRPPEGFTFRNGRWLDAKGYDAGFAQFGYTTEGVPFWLLVNEGDAQGTMSLQTTGGITERSPYCLGLAIELNQSPVGRHVRGQVETGRWYDVKVELAGNRIRCYLDGKLIHDETAPATEHFYAVAGREFTYEFAGSSLTILRIRTK